MEEKIKEILGKQLELLAEVSEGKPENLVELSVAMCKIANRLAEVRSPICNDRALMSETMHDILLEESKACSTRRNTAPGSAFPPQRQPSGL